MLQHQNPGRTSQNSLLDWFDSALGSYILAQERSTLNREVRRFHGETMLWLGPIAPCRLEVELSRCMVRYHIFGSLNETAVRSGANTSAACYVGNADNLPLAPSCVKAIVCHHGLECAHDSVGALRELSRVLEPGGRLLLSAFNPYSFWGLRHIVSRFQSNVFSDLRFVSPFRVRNWLRVLGLEMDSLLTYVAYRPPLEIFSNREFAAWQKIRRLCQRWGLPFGGVYVLTARKRDLGYTAPLTHSALGTKSGITPVVLSQRIALADGVAANGEHQSAFLDS